MDVAASFRALAPAGRLAAQVLGSIYPLACSATELARVLRVAGIELDGRALTVAGLTRAAEEAVESGLVAPHRSGKSALAGVEQAATWLTREASRGGILEPIQNAHGKEAKASSRRLERDWQRMEVRCKTVSGNFEALGDRVPSECWTFLAQPGATDLLATLPERFRNQALQTCLGEVIRHAAPAEAIITACYASSTDLAALASDIAFVRVLQGRMDDALKVFDALPAERSDTPAVRSDQKAVQALIALVRGDCDTARRCLQRHHAARIESPRRPAGVALSAPLALSLLALVQRDAPEDRNLFKAFLELPRRGLATTTAQVAMYASALRVGRTEPLWTLNSYPRGFNLLLLGLAGCWPATEPPPFLPVHSSEAFHGYVERLAADRVLWALAECLTVIADPHACLYPHGGRSRAAAAKQAASIHSRLGTRSLAGVLPKVPAWEPPLKALEHFSFETRRQAGADAERGSDERQRRLAWRVRRRFGRVEVAAYQQHLARNGRWTKGEARSAEWIAEYATDAADLLPQDRAAAAAIDQYAHAWQMHRSTHAVLFALTGHPRVFNTAGDTVEVVRIAPELVIDRRGGTVHLRLLPADWDGDRYHSRMAADRRCEVMEATRQQQRLRRIFPLGGLLLPTTAAARVLQAAAGLLSIVRLRGDDLPGVAPVGRLVEGHAEPSVRLVPYAAGLAATLVVEPLPESELYFAPGCGGELVFGYRNGEALQVRRDLQAERAAVAVLAAACPRLAGIERDPWSVQLPATAHALELLEQLSAAKARCLWPHGQPYRIVRGDAAQLKLRIKSSAEWLRAGGELPIDPRRTLDLKQLFTLLDAQPGARFLELTGGEFLALTASFRRQLEDLRGLSSPAEHGEIRLHPLAALSLTEFVAETQLEADTQWALLQQRLREAREIDPEVPAALRGRLRSYQLDGFRWLARLSRWGAGACLADDMGLGKTIQTLALLLDRAPAGPALVVAPTSVAANWLAEARRFAPQLNVAVYAGVGAARARLLDAPGPFDLVITTYALLHIDAERLQAVSWNSVVLDEAQAIKTPNTKRARAARGLNAQFRMVTTGTPIQNNLTDLHSLFSFLNPGMLGSPQHFRRVFAVPIEQRADTAARERLRRLVAPFILRRMKTDVLHDLPPRTEITLHVEMSPDEAAFYEALRLRAVEDLESMSGPVADSRLRILAHLMRLRRACCNPALVHAGAAPPSSKLAMFADTLADLLANDHRVLVFSQFVDHLKLVEAHLKQQAVTYQYLDGSTTHAARRDRVAAFQAGQGEAFLISLGAGGVGLNLTAADYVIHLDPWWNPAVEDQASDRAHRIGQTRSVTIYRLVTKGTIEEQIVDLHRHKRDLAERLLAAGDAPGRLDAGELLALLRQPLR